MYLVRKPAGRAGAQVLRQELFLRECHLELRERTEESLGLRWELRELGNHVALAGIDREDRAWATVATEHLIVHHVELLVVPTSIPTDSPMARGGPAASGVSRVRTYPAKLGQKLKQ